MPRGRPWLDDYSALGELLAKELERLDMSEFAMREIIEASSESLSEAYEKKTGEPLNAEISDALRRAIRYVNRTTAEFNEELPFQKVTGTNRYKYNGSRKTPHEVGELERAIQNLNKLVEKQFLDKLSHLKELLPQGPARGNALVAFTEKLLGGLGFKITSSPKLVGDWGIDSSGSKVDEFGLSRDYLIQLKHWESGTVSKSAVEPLGNQLSYPEHLLKYGLVITTSKFSMTAIELERNQGRIRLIDGPQLFKLCVENDVGVNAQDLEVAGKPLQLYSIDAEWFEELEVEFKATITEDALAAAT